MRGVVVCLALGLVVRSIGPAHAVTVQEFNTTYSEVAKVKGMLAAIDTEVFRANRAGYTAKAACIYDHFIPRTGMINGFDSIVRGVLDSKKPTTETVEGYIVGTIANECNNAGTAETTASAPVAPVLTPLNDFFAMVPNPNDEIAISRMALATQAMRAANDGHQEYSQCIMDKLYNPTPAGQPQPGFLELFRQLGVNRATAMPIEKFFVGAIVHYCGEEPATVSTSSP